MIIRSICLLSSALIPASAVGSFLSEAVLAQEEEVTTPVIEIEGGEAGPRIIGGRSTGEGTTQQIDLVVGDIGIDALMVSSPNLEQASRGQILDREGNEVEYTSSRISPTTVVVSLGELVSNQTLRLVIQGIETQAGGSVTYNVEAQNNVEYPGTWFPVGLITVTARDVGSGQ